MSPDELEFVATLVALLSFVVAGIFLAAGQPLRSAWVTLVGGGILVTLVQGYAIYLRII